MYPNSTAVRADGGIIKGQMVEAMATSYLTQLD
jgi:hypothetical protein